MKIKTIKAKLCNCCGEVYHDYDEETHQQETVRAYECGECEQIYEDRDEAKECCT